MGSLRVKIYYNLILFISLSKGVTRKDANFIGYTFNREVET
jgi:hypothetical protein